MIKSKIYNFILKSVYFNIMNYAYVKRQINNINNTG